MEVTLDDSRILLDCIWLVVLLFQQTSRWLKFFYQNESARTMLLGAEGRRLCQQAALDQTASVRFQLPVVHYLSNP